MTRKNLIQFVQGHKNSKINQKSQKQITQDKNFTKLTKVIIHFRGVETTFKVGVLVAKVGDKRK